MAKKVESTSTDIQTTGTKAMTSFDYGEDAVPVGQVGRGFEGQTNEDVSIPFIKLMQPGSPQVAGQTIEGIQAGMFLHTVSNKLWSNKTGGLLYVCGFTRHEFLQWKPEAQGGGFVGRHNIEDPAVLKAKAASKKFGEYFVDADGRTGMEGDELSETFTTFGVACDDDGSMLGMVCFPFRGTGIKTYKSWMTQVRAHTTLIGDKKMMTPLFAHLGRFTTEFKQKDKNSWWEPRWEPASKMLDASCIAPDDERFVLAKQVKKMMESGVAKVDYSRMQSDGPATDDGKPPF